MANTWKEWEKPIIEIDEQLAKARALAKTCPDEEREIIEERIADYEKRRDNLLNVLYKRLGPWEKVLVARSEPRPYTLDYIAALCSDFVELGGDRRFGDDNAIVGGPAMVGDRKVMVIGQQKGRNIQERQFRNFGMARPHGYRKAIRLMEMADRFKLPIVSFVDTPAADPGVESESMGISEAIAASILAMFEVRVPTVTVIIGEGGSGGAIALAIGNHIHMLEHSVYSVIPPEGCAAILWRQPSEKMKAAAALRLTAESALEFGLIDTILPEPVGAAHRDLLQTFETVRTAIDGSLSELEKMSGDQLRDQRYNKFRAMGRMAETLAVVATKQK